MDKHLNYLQGDEFRNRKVFIELTIYEHNISAVGWSKLNLLILTKDDQGTLGFKSFYPASDESHSYVLSLRTGAFKHVGRKDEAGFVATRQRLL